MIKFYNNSDIGIKMYTRFRWVFDLNTNEI